MNDPGIPYEEKAELLKALVHPLRLRIVRGLLKCGCRNVTCMERNTGQSQSCISQHLAKLRLGHVVASRNEGPRVYYRLIDEHARILVRPAVFQAQHVTGNLPADHRIGVDHD